MSSEETQRLLLASLGVNERTARTLKMYFKGPCQGRYKLTDQHEVAHTVLVDVDGLASPGEVSDYRNIFPGRPVVLLAKEAPAEPELLFLQKPLHMETLVQTLEQLRQRLLGGAAVVEIPPCEPPPPVTDAERQMVRSARKYLQDANIADICGNQADVNLQDRKQREKMQFPFEETWLARFVAAWQLARSKGMPVRFNMLSKPVVILPGARKIICTISERELRAVAVVRADVQSALELMQETELQFFQKLMTSGKGLVHEPLEPFLWRLALWTSRGRAPQKTDFNVPLFLRHWPNFTRLLLTPSALQIAALWLHQPHSLATTAQVLGIPQRYVLTFYTATQVLDLSGTSRREADYLFAEPLPVEQHEHRSVFGRMIDRLSGSEKK